MQANPDRLYGIQNPSPVSKDGSVSLLGYLHDLPVGSYGRMRGRSDIVYFFDETRRDLVHAIFGGLKAELHRKGTDVIDIEELAALRARGVNL
jgi:hypothetical protein